MVNSGGHIMGGIIVSALSMWYLWDKIALTIYSLPIVATIIYFYAQLPDIDHESSKITWTLLTIGAAITIYGFFISFISDRFVQIPGYNTFYFGIGIMLVTILFAKTKHRGITHTIWFCLFSPLLLFLIPNLPNVWLFSGIAALSCYSHLLLDGYIFKTTSKPIKGMW
jgi:membrane-bound metal-dependent hydrolase YbcI (DUF457 family)